MRSIERKFRIESDKANGVSSVVCFVRAIKGKNYSERVISYWFKKMVDKEDYRGVPKLQLMEYLVGVSNS